MHRIIRLGLVALYVAQLAAIHHGQIVDAYTAALHAVFGATTADSHPVHGQHAPVHAAAAHDTHSAAAAVGPTSGHGGGLAALWSAAVTHVPPAGMHMDHDDHRDHLLHPEEREKTRADRPRRKARRLRREYVMANLAGAIRRAPVHPTASARAYGAFANSLLGYGGRTTMPRVP